MDKERNNEWAEIFIAILLNLLCIAIMGFSTLSMTIQLFKDPKKFFYYKEEPDIKIQMNLK